MTLTPLKDRIWVPRREPWTPQRPRLWTPARQRRALMPRWWARVPAVLMADGDEIVDDLGNEKLYDGGEEVPAAATGSACCCPGGPCVCTTSSGDAILSVLGWTACDCLVTGGSWGGRAKLAAGADFNGTYNLAKVTGTTLCQWRLYLYGANPPGPMGDEVRYFSDEACATELDPLPIEAMQVDVSWTYSNEADQTRVTCQANIFDGANVSWLFDGESIVSGCQQCGAFTLTNNQICGDVGVATATAGATVTLPCP